MQVYLLVFLSGAAHRRWRGNARGHVPLRAQKRASFDKFDKIPAITSVSWSFLGRIAHNLPHFHLHDALGIFPTWGFVVRDAVGD